MTKILVAEDSATQAIQVKTLLEQDGFEVSIAVNGKEAVDLIAAYQPDVVLTDLEMPIMNGLELVRAVKQTYPALPVVLMTNRGSEEVAMEALRAGASSYLPKRILPQVGEIIQEVYLASKKEIDSNLLLNCLQGAGYKFNIGNQWSLIQPMVAHISAELERFKYDDMEIMQVTMAFTEALTNAVYHGNLELDSRLREEESGSELYHQLAAERCLIEPFSRREVTIQTEVSDTEIQILVCDEGPGFDLSQIPDPTDPENLEKASGRGLMLIFTFMDEVKHNTTGNAIKMTKRRGSASDDEDDDGEYE